MTDLPNVVMLVTDNQSADSLGCYGNTEHETAQPANQGRGQPDDKGGACPVQDAR